MDQEHEFQIDDIVIGNELATRYRITTTGVKAKVVDVIKKHNILVVTPLIESEKNMTYPVDSECFDLFFRAQDATEEESSVWNTLLKGGE